MAKYKFKSSLSTDGINNLIRELQHYRDYTLQQKREMLVQKLLDVGAEKAKVRLEISPVGNFVHINVKTESGNNSSRAYLIATGDVWESEGYEPFNVMLAVEFGAGIVANQGKKQPNPKGADFGYGVGTYNPDSKHALDKNGWYYFDEREGTWKHSYGIQATMPMYSADMEIIKKYKGVVREISRMR